MCRLSHAVLLSAVLWSGCSSSPATPSETPTPLAVTRLAADAQTSFTYNSGLLVPQRTVVRDQAAWREMWTAIYRTQTPEPALPAIDFTREMVVVVALGVQISGGYTILIASASATPGGVTVDTRTLIPSIGCAPTLALTQPVDIARLPRRETPVVFNDRQETVECRTTP